MAWVSPPSGCLPGSIGNLERFIADYERSAGRVGLPVNAPSTGKRVAIVGSGPAALSAAGDLVQMGHAVTVFEALHEIDRPVGALVEVALAQAHIVIEAVQAQGVGGRISHCARCRADAAGIIGEEPSAELATLMQHYAHTSLHPEETEARPYVAVASMEGVLVNQHLGEADRFLVYEPRPGVEGAYQLKEIRMAPPAGGGADRWTELAGQLKDCRALLAAAAGPMPMGVLTQAGVKVVEMEGFIEEGLRAVYGNRAVPAPMKRRFSGCSRGSDCQGTGTGCG